jgi:hypothetical protein
MRLSDFYKTSVGTSEFHKQDKPKREKKIRKYKAVCPEFVAEFKKDLEDGWSIGYACRSIPHELRAVKRAFSQYPELKKLYDAYMLNKSQKYFHIRK